VRILKLIHLVQGKVLDKGHENYGSINGTGFLNS